MRTLKKVHTPDIAEIVASAVMKENRKLSRDAVNQYDRLFNQLFSEDKKLKQKVKK